MSPNPPLRSAASRDEAWERLRQASHPPAVAPVADPQVDERLADDAVAVTALRNGRHAAPEDWSRPLRAVVVITLVAIVVAALLFWRAMPREIATTSADTPDAAASLGEGDASSFDATAPNADGPRLIVHVVGQVKRPGIVTLAPGSRVADAVKAAGGLKPGTDPASINLARPVSDGEQVVVATAASPNAAGPSNTASGGGTSSSGGSAADARVDLNTASATEFEALDGVGPVLAERLVAWRTENGRFARIEDLQEVSGIGPKVFARLKDQVRV